MKSFSQRGEEKEKGEGKYLVSKEEEDPKRKRVFTVRTLQYDQLLWENAIPAGVTTFSSTLEKCLILIMIIIMIIIIITIIFTGAPFPDPPYVKLDLQMSTKKPPFPKSYIQTFDLRLSKDSLYWLASCQRSAKKRKSLWNNFCYDVYWQGNTGIGLGFDENLGRWAWQNLGFQNRFLVLLKRIFMMKFCTNFHVNFVNDQNRIAFTRDSCSILFWRICS